MKPTVIKISCEWILKAFDGSLHGCVIVSTGRCDGGSHPFIRTHFVLNASNKKSLQFQIRELGRTYEALGVDVEIDKALPKTA